MRDAGRRGTGTAWSWYLVVRTIPAAVFVLAFFLYLLWIYQPILMFLAAAVIVIATAAILVLIRRGRIG